MAWEEGGDQGYLTGNSGTEYQGARTHGPNLLTLQTGTGIGKPGLLAQADEIMSAGVNRGLGTCLGAKTYHICPHKPPPFSAHFSLFVPSGFPHVSVLLTQKFNQKLIQGDITL